MGVAAILAIPLVLRMVNSLFSDTYTIPSPISELASTLFMALIVGVVLRDLFTSKKVDEALIIGAVSLYFLLGLLWTFIYLSIESFSPGSFNYNYRQPLEAKPDSVGLLYYSLVTLTTLGYGDITPLSSTARAMATMQAIVGQLYLTVLVARLVGMHIAQKSGSSTARTEASEQH